MSRRTILNIVLILAILAAAIGGGTAMSYYAHLPERLSQHETIVLGQSRLSPGASTALRVVVRNSRDAVPLEGAEIEVSMQPQAGGEPLPLYRGVSDSQGTADISFRVPEVSDPAQTLLITTRSSLGSDVVERLVTVQRDYRVLLTTDKPLYQPGQTIHMRALALGSFDLTPAAGQNLEINITDGKGNRVSRQSLVTSDFGSASVDFQLASEVNTGDYKITAILGNTSSEKTVSVEHYVLPKFNLDLQTAKPYYLPGEHVSGSLQADYFYGKPVAGGNVALEGFTFDFEKVTVFTLEGSTNDNGSFEFEFDLPSYIAGSDLEGGQARFYLQTTVTDLAQHSETSNLSLPVSNSTLVINAIPEGGQFYSQIENILYVLTSYPDGSPADADLTLTFYDTGLVFTAESGEYGLAEFHFTPQNSWQNFRIDARDNLGNLAGRDFYFEGNYLPESVLLRPDKPVYRVGETMNLSIFTSQPSGTVYLDIVREGQTLSTRSVSISDAHADFAIDLTPDLFGTLELHAYKILSDGSIIRDTRLVVVDNASDLAITLTPDQQTYLPGAGGTLDILVQDADGNGVQSALGLAIVDESVFALAEEDPGFAKLYFLLEQQILTPRYDVHGFSIPDLVQGIPGDSAGMTAAIENAARASLAEAAGSTSGFGLQANSHIDAVQRATVRQADFFKALSTPLYIIFLLIALFLFILSSILSQRSKVLGNSLAWGIGITFALWLAYLLFPVEAFGYYYLQTPLSRLSFFLDRFLNNPARWWLAAILTGGFGVIVLLVAARRGKDGLGAWMPVLAVLLPIVLAGISLAVSYSADSVPTSALTLGMLAMTVGVLAFLVRFVASMHEKKALPALASLGLASFLIVVSLPALSAGAMSASYDPVGLREGGGMVFKEGLMAVEEAMPAAMAPMATEMPMAQLDEAQAGATGAAQQTPRLRQYFPETMLWLPDEITDENGHLTVDLSMADSITTWRVTALASSQDGRLGSATAPLRVFQDFFIDLDLPLSLTVGDEISVPVGVFNYLASEQTVRLELEQEDWFELLDEPVKEMTIAANDISVVYFRIRATAFGSQPFQVTAYGTSMSDAIRKEVRVYPDGKEMTYTLSDRLEPGSPISETVQIPAGIVSGTQRLYVKIYPGMVSQVVEGLDSILRMPNGCFEQTSSTTYPNVLVLDYLRSTGQVSPETEMKAEEYINLGYQRLTTFEVDGGGFSLFGDVPADRMLTAYGLQEFADMSRVFDVDPALVSRAASWLLSQQTADGSWENDQGLVHENTWSSLGNDRLPVTAYITWSLIDAGFADSEGTPEGLQYVREFQSQAEDAYVLALVANALVSGDLHGGGTLSTTTQDVLERLAGMAKTEGESTWWESGIATFMGSEGQTGSIETTALAALAFQRTDLHPELVNGALTYLIRSKDGYGTWYSTQATVLALKALIENARIDASEINSTVTVTLNGGQAHTLQVTPENFDVVQVLAFDDVSAGIDNQVEINAEGTGSLMYQVTGSYYLPWDEAALLPETSGTAELLGIDVTYDRTELAVNDSVTVNVTVTMNEPGGNAKSAIIDLGLPPGFSVQSEDLDALVAYYNDTPEDYAYPTIERYELTGRQIILYISNLGDGFPLTFSYRLRARFPLEAQAPSSTAYDYYNPDVTGEAAPQMLVVTP